VATTISGDVKRPEPQAVAGAIEALAARFGNRLITSQAVREQHAHTTTWLPTQPPDAVVMAQETADIQDVVRICARHTVPVIAFGTGTSLEGQVNAPAGGVCIDLHDMNKVLEVHADDLDCVIQPGLTRKALNEHLRDQGVFFPIDPGADASLGGMASTRASGTNAVRYGTMRDNVLALKVVRGDGAIITTGTRAKKSSAGHHQAARHSRDDRSRRLFVRDGARRLPGDDTRDSNRHSRRAHRTAQCRTGTGLQFLFEIDAARDAAAAAGIPRQRQ
jgi:D-lactate dehydrogenase (cytochrome)